MVAPPVSRPAAEVSRSQPAARPGPLVSATVALLVAATCIPLGYVVWGAISVGGLYKSHRPVTPFVGGSSGVRVYDEPNSSSSIARFFYPRESDILDLSQIPDGAIDETSPSTMNAVGRHHPGKDKKGGTANFAYVDGHVAQDTVLQTLKDRKWGDRFWSLTGDNKVNPVERD